MRSKFLSLVLLCTLFAACASEDIKVTGITRSKAIQIAETNCKEYPDRFAYMDSAEWNSTGHFWVVELTDYRGGHGKTFKINGQGKVIGVETIGNGSADRDS
ncbi:MAG: hypothetical protein WCH43_01910, partial [Verrucomicrobiota bacterium]